MLKDQAPKARGSAVSRARKLRKDMTLPEVMLWKLLRGSPQGVKFRRQHPSGDLVLDFYCLDARLAIEIEGISHDMGDRPERDQRRDGWLKSQGIDTVRIAASDVLKDANMVAEGIMAMAFQRLPLHHPAKAETSPSAREGQVGLERKS
ncbi:endonuclease domain-containing protein [Parasphingorhabdus sp. DH2-15]|uniref:endonuclease domain-containing protein n=1 Tax=Parasphingorhabdus sp. DH2-15 TaxID=3444112 RepID=UPI003F6839B7